MEGRSTRRAAAMRALAGVLAALAFTTLLATCARAADERSDFESSFYFGLGIDSFAASELQKYLNPEESGVKHERGVGGFDFAYRLVGDSTYHRQLWVYGETVHGVRSADLDLAGTDSLAAFRLTGVADPGSRTLFMLRNATSLEASLGMRFDFLQLHTRDPRSTAEVYVMGEIGFLTVAGLGQDFIDVHRYGLGVECVGGSLRGSHLEIGSGRTDLFAQHRLSRFKIDGELSWTTDAMQAHGMSMFTQLTIDADLGPGSDSAESFIGMNFDLGQFLQLAK